MTKHQAVEALAPEAPAKVGPNQAFVTESYTNILGGPKRYRNVGEHPLTLAWHKGRITDQQHEAGRIYRKLYETMVRSGKSSLDFLPVSSSQSGTYGLTQAQFDAIRELEKIDKQLSRNDRVIVRKLCGEGYSPDQAMRLAGLNGGKRTTERVSEALDELVRAIKHIT